VREDQIADEFHRTGFAVVPDFITGPDLTAAQEALWTAFPRPEVYFANPDKFKHLQRGQFAGLQVFPFSHFDLNRLLVHDRLVALARTLIGTDDVRLYKGELWGKYGGGIDYEQHHHRDFSNHTLVVPRADRRWLAVTTFLYLCDVTAANGATAAVPLQYSRSIPLGVNWLPPGELREHEVLASGRAGTLLVYATDVFHRGTAFTDPTASRFSLLADYRSADSPWIQKQAFGNQGNRAETAEFITRITPEQRTLLDIPPPGHPYWNDQTVTDMAIRYPDIDMTPYRDRL
jgi:ectoine hydroxylase-related dioxygenase (phytanoyl-CoA dioxygenase family)